MSNEAGDSVLTGQPGLSAEARVHAALEQSRERHRAMSQALDEGRADRQVVAEILDNLPHSFWNDPLRSSGVADFLIRALLGD